MGDLTESCDGMCVTAADVGLPGHGNDAIAHVHPGCPRHDPGGICDCGTPERCMSPTHGRISLATALIHRHSQNPGDPRAWPHANEVSA